MTSIENNKSELNPKLSASTSNLATQKKPLVEVESQEAAQVFLAEHQYT